jgi:hypothetical protein
MLVPACDRADPISPPPPQQSVQRSAAPVVSFAQPPASLSARAAASSSAPLPTPEQLSKGMRGSVPCGPSKCKAGVEVCVSSPDPNHRSHCERIRRWDQGRTPVPWNGAPAMAGITACGGSHHCPANSVCCLHEIGQAEVQAAVCHARLGECREPVELCDRDAPEGCRTPGTRCDEWQCVPVRSVTN